MPLLFPWVLFSSILLILSWFVGGKQCIFPFVSYAFFSGILTLYLRDKKPNFQGMARFSYLFSAFILMMGIIHGIINGFPSVSEWYFGYHPFFLYHLNLAAQLIWFSSFVLFFDTIPIKERKSHKRYKYVIIFQRLSTISLTIFLFEEIFAAVYSKFTEIIFPNMIIQNNLFLFIWTFFYTFIWISTLNNWDKNCNFKFSIEWFLARIFAGKSTKKDSKRDYLNLDFMIYYPLGVKDKKEYYANKSNN